MQARLRHFHGVFIDRETVRQLLLYVDPVGVYSRRRRRLVRRRYVARGPNYLLHIDGWDKLKPYGICVHGAIDGFSRRIMWLQASRSNNDPFQICHYFCQMVKQLGGLPHIVRSDRGTENVNIERVQILLREQNNDPRGISRTSFLYGRSCANQRIESWWSRFPSMGMETWINHFKQLQHFGIIDTSNHLHIELIRFCFMGILRTELKKVQIEWNTHHIRPVSTSLAPSGKPDIIYFFPEIYDARSYLHNVDDDLLEELTEVATDDLDDCEVLHKELFENVFQEMNLDEPVTLSDASRNYVTILDTIEEEIREMN